MKKKTLFFNLLYVVLIVAVIYFLFWMVGWMQEEGARCLADPLWYFQNKTGDTCFCQGKMVFGRG